ncbi:MAG TPA: glycosyltransferase family 39 protein, partial [Thermoanaerobaculia bacterium]
MSNVARHVCTAALLLLVAAAAVRDVVVLGRFAKEVPFGKYLTLADSVVAGNLPADRMNDVSPLYLWSVSAGRAIHLSPWALSWIQIVGTLIAALLAALTARALAGDMAGLAAALALLASCTVVLNASELEPEVLILLLNALAIWLLLGKERPSPFLAGVAAAASVMTRPTAILPLIVLGALAARDR